MSISILRKYAKRWFRRHGYEFRKLGTGELDDINRLVRLCEVRNINTFLDIGANKGQFAIDLRFAGYRQKIISFEPLESAHRQLSERADPDRNWLIAPRVAVGRAVSEASINVSANSFSSSMLPMREAHVKCAPQSAYVGMEQVSVRPLSNLLSELNVPPHEKLAIKIDTQGYEAEVLYGAMERISLIEVIFVELSLASLYDGAPDFHEIYKTLTKHDFRCVALSHEFSDPVTGEMLQVNGTFVR